MKKESKFQYSIFAIFTLLLVVGCGAAAGVTVTPTPEPTPQPPGTITGVAMYENLDGAGQAEPLPNVMIVLCKLGAGLPGGPAVAESSDHENICVLQQDPHALTNSDGLFTLENVPPGDYLLLFHLFPQKLEGQAIQWSSISITEAGFNGIKGEAASSGQPDFWENGGPVLGSSSWSAAGGMVVTSGNVCSHKYGLCFSILEEQVHPVVSVAPNGSVETKITSYFLPEE